MAALSATHAGLVEAVKIWERHGAEEGVGASAQEGWAPRQTLTSSAAAQAEALETSRTRGHPRTEAPITGSPPHAERRH